MSIINNPGAVSAIILAGGESFRMGYPKPWLPLKNSVTFLSKIIDIFREVGVTEVVTVLNHHFATDYWKYEICDIKLKTNLILNFEIEAGRLQSLRLGLENVSSRFTFIHNVDNPFITTETCKVLLPQETDEVIVPVYKGVHGHPVVIGNSVMNEVIQNYVKYNSLRELLKGFHTRNVDVDEASILTNINSPADYLESIK